MKINKDKVSIEIGEQKFVLQFGYACLRNLGTIWGVPDLVGVIEKMTSLGLETGQVSFDAMDAIADLVLAAIHAKNNDVPAEINRDAVCDYIMANTSKMTEIMEAFMESMPQAEQPGKRKPVKKN